MRGRRTTFAVLLLLSSTWFVVSAAGRFQQESRLRAARETTQFRPPLESPSAFPVAPVIQDSPSNAPAFDAPEGVPGGLVVVSELPSTPEPLELGPGQIRSHIQGDLYQDQQIESGETTDLLPAPGEESFEPSRPARGEAAPSAAAADLPSAPGGFVDQWTALSNTGWIPPDTIHAVGPNHVVEAVNSGFAVYTKFGTQVQGYTTYQSFLHKPAGWQGFMFDPRIVYDATHAKFVMLALGRDDTNLESYFWIAVSQTSDPTAGWWRWRFGATDTSGSSRAWLDYAGLAADTWGVYVTGNYFYWSGGFRGSNLWSINPAIFSGGATNGWRFLDLRWPNNSAAFAIQPAQPHSVNSNQTTYFVNTFSGSGNQVLLWKLTGDRTSSPGLTRVAIGTAGYDSIGMNVDQPGSATDIHGGDARVMNAVYSQRRVYFTLTDDVNSNGAASGWLTVKLNSDTNVNEWQHLLWGGNGFYYFYPALTVLGGSGTSPNIAVFGSWTQTAEGSGQFASGLYKIYDNHPTDAGGPFVNIASGSAAYVRFDNQGRNRWGDYSGAGYDWQCGHAWGAVESADTNNRWRTTIAGRLFGNESLCPMIEVTAANGGEVWNAGTSHSIQWQRRGLPSGQQVRLFYNTGGSDTLIATLANTASSYNWTVPAVRSSTVRVRVRAWSGSSYGASDLSDANFRITAPDLRTINPGVSDNTLLPGQSFTLSATARNFGDGSSSATTLRYFRSTNATIDTGDTLIGTDAVGALAASASSAENIVVNAPSTTGTFWVGACVASVAGETPTNNQCSTGVSISVREPDLVISALSAPASAYPGQSVVAANTVRNAGTIETGGASTVALYYSADSVCTKGAPDVLLANRPAPALDAGATSAVNTPVTIPPGAAGGTRYLCAFADAANAIDETDESNNVGIHRFEVVPPSVNLEINGEDAVFPLAVNTAGPVKLTLDMTPGPSPVDHYFLILVGGTVYYLDATGNLVTTPTPLGTFAPVSLTDFTLLDLDLSSSPGAWVFGWFMLDAGTVVGSDLIQANVAP